MDLGQGDLLGQVQGVGSDHWGSSRNPEQNDAKYLPLHTHLKLEHLQIVQKKKRTSTQKSRN